MRKDDYPTSLLVDAACDRAVRVPVSASPATSPATGWWPSSAHGALQDKIRVFQHNHIPHIDVRGNTTLAAANWTFLVFRR
jgi:hypothetical protein